MSFISMLISIFIVYKVIQSFKKRVSEEGGKPNSPTGPLSIPTPQAKYERPAPKPQFEQSVSKPGQGQLPSKPQNEPSRHSTMGYLHEKAMQDEKEHRKEEAETARKIKQRSNGRTPAKQLYLGDPVPNNCRCVVCSYCGAENLIPLNSRDRYCCYFCREAL